MNELLTIDIATIDIAAGENPRGSIDADGLQPLADSIARHGVLQPIIVRPGGQGDMPYTLVAGERRLTAAGIAGLTEIPAVVRDLNGDAGAVALVENLQREQLSPIEEARAFKRAFDEGMTLAQLAEVISVSHDTVKERVALLQLPATVQSKIDTRELTLSAAKALQRFAPLGDAVVAKAAELLDDELEPLAVRDLETDPANVFSQVLEALDERAPFAVEFRKDAIIYLEGRRGSITWPDGVDAAALEAKAAQLPEQDAETYKSPRWNALRVTTADLDAARAYGCLLELDGSRGRGWRADGPWVTDPAWLYDRLNEKLDKAIKAWERTVKSRATKKAKAAGVEVGKGDDPAKLLREQRARENAEKRAAQLAARERNVSLRIALTRELHAPTVTVDGLRAIGELLLTYAGEDLGRRGWRFVDERAETVTTKKSGDISKIAYVRTGSELLHEAFAKASTVEEMYGVLIRALVATRFAETDAAIASDRGSHVRGLSDYRPNKALVDAIERLAEPVLPADVVIALEERRAAEQRELEETAKAELEQIRQGHERCPSCGQDPITHTKRRSNKKPADWSPCRCTDEQITDAIVACPRCGEPECYASCSSFDAVAEVDETA
jgi:ParB/RepB/Spo0J family partition protein